jgi:hypothetical protein
MIIIVFSHNSKKRKGKKKINFEQLFYNLDKLIIRIKKYSLNRYNLKIMKIEVSII